MTFQNLRVNHTIYILHKDVIPTLEIGKISNITNPVPQYGNIYNNSIDISIDINGKSTNFQKVPANNEIADFGNNIVLAANKDAINNEVISMKQRSLDIINNIQQHQNIVKGCDEILQTINPEIAEKQRQEEENKALRCEINQLKEMVQEFIKTWQQ